MIKESFITWPCDTCSNLNDIPLDYFINLGSENERPVIASCECCDCKAALTLQEIFKRHSS